MAPQAQPTRVCGAERRCGDLQRLPQVPANARDPANGAAAAAAATAAGGTAGPAAAAEQHQ